LQAEVPLQAANLGLQAVLPSVPISLTEMRIIPLTRLGAEGRLLECLREGSPTEHQGDLPKEEKAKEEKVFMGELPS
jgi:hypothetical protein